MTQSGLLIRDRLEHLAWSLAALGAEDPRISATVEPEVLNALKAIITINFQRTGTILALDTEMSKLGPRVNS